MIVSSERPTVGIMILASSPFNRISGSFILVLVDLIKSCTASRSRSAATSGRPPNRYAVEKVTKAPSKMAKVANRRQKDRDGSMPRQAECGLEWRRHGRGAAL